MRGSSSALRRCGERTALVHRLHDGPLACSARSIPSATARAHAYVLHPPGGVVGGDRLTLDVHAGAGDARADHDAGREQAVSERRPARAHRAAHPRGGRRAPGVAAAGDASPTTARRSRSTRASSSSRTPALIAWDISCLGRPAIGERLTRGCVEQRLAVTRAGEPLLLERARYDGGARRAQRRLGPRRAAGDGHAAVRRRRARPTELAARELRERARARRRPRRDRVHGAGARARVSLSRRQRRARAACISSGVGGIAHAVLRERAGRAADLGDLTAAARRRREYGRPRWN